MEDEFILAILVAAFTFIIALKNKRMASALGQISALVILGPIFFYAIAGMMGMLNADAEAVQSISDSTVTKIIDYVGGQLPSILISDLAGALVGAIGGTLVKIKNSNSR
jgi:hypothetical protein